MNVNIVKLGDNPEDEKVQIVEEIALSVAKLFGAREDVNEQIIGYVKAKFESLENKLIKYYGYKWYDYASQNIVLAKHIRKFIEDSLKNGIEAIVKTSGYEEPQNSVIEETEEVPQEEPAKGLDEAKSNYIYSIDTLDDLSNQNKPIPKQKIVSIRPKDKIEGKRLRTYYAQNYPVYPKENEPYPTEKQMKLKLKSLLKRRVNVKDIVDTMKSGGK